MSKSEENEERLLRAASNRRRNRDGGDGTPEVRPTAKRTKPIRFTVDMQPPLHRRLRAWTMTVAGEELDAADVSSAEVVRSLVDLLTNVHRDQELRKALTAAVLDDLRETRH